MELQELNLTEEQMAIVNKALQSEGDKVRTKYSTEMKELKDELNQYKPIERSDSEKSMDKRLKALELKEQEIANKEKSYAVKEKLQAKGLPSDLAKYISVGDDVDSTIEELGGTLNNFFLSNGYKPSSHTKSEGITKEQFSKMSYAERAKLYETNPTLYKALAN
ncbi:capsid assembly scaffolding protein Gp46 family protein [Anaerosporobacter sp.]